MPTCRSCCEGLTVWKEKRTSDDPLAGLSQFTEATDRQHVRRRLTPEELVRLLAHPQGLAKGRPAGARAAVLLNQADGAAELAAAEEIARGLLGTRAGYERVVAAALGAGRGEPAVRAVWRDQPANAREKP